MKWIIVPSILVVFQISLNYCLPNSAEVVTKERTGSNERLEPPVNSTEIKNGQNKTNNAENNFHPKAVAITTPNITSEIQVAGQEVKLVQKQTNYVDLSDPFYQLLQNGIRDMYFTLKGDSHRQKMEEQRIMEESFNVKIQALEIDLNAKILMLETSANNKIQALTEQFATQRKEDIQTFSENINQMQKIHNTHAESQRLELSQMKSTVESLTKGQSNLSTKMSQLQKTVHSLDTKMTEMFKKHAEDINVIQETQKRITVTTEDMEREVRAVEAISQMMQSRIQDLEKAAKEDHNKLRKTMIRDQKSEPIQNAIRHLRTKGGVNSAVKQWRIIEQISEDLTDTLIPDIKKIIEDAYERNQGRLRALFDFIHKSVGSNGDIRLKEAAYSFLLLEMDAAKQLSDKKDRLDDMFRLAFYMKADLGSTFNISSSTAEVISRLPEAVRLLTFEKVKLALPSRGYLRVGPDKKISLVPEDGTFFLKDEILWQFEYDRDKSDGTFHIRSDKFNKYLIAIHEGFNSYGFSKQTLTLTGNKKESGTRFQVSNVTGEHLLLKSGNGFLTWKSSIQTIYGDDDSYFVLIQDRKNGPSPYWLIEAENEF